MKFLKKFAFGAFLCSVFCICLALTAFANSTALTNDGGADVRGAAGADAALLGTLEPDSVVNVLDTDGEWFKITYNGGTAYVELDSLRLVTVSALVNGTNVNIRSAASVSSAILGKLNVGDVVTIDSLSGDFYRILHNNSIAYVHKDFVSASMLSYLGDAPIELPDSSDNLYASVSSSSGVNLRIAPGTDFDIICVIPQHHNVDVLALEDDWLYVRYNGSTGYVSSEFMEILSGPAPSNAMASQVIEFALKYLGTPYKWAGTTLGKGVDCSGFVYAVYKNFGIGLSRTSRDMINNGVKISKSELKPGDLVFFDTSGANNGAISHVGLYIGGGEFVHASSGKSYSVIISSLSEQYYINAYVGSCRILK